MNSDDAGPGGDMEDREVVSSIAKEFRRQKSLGERTMDQLTPEELCRGDEGVRSSVVTLVWHIAGNLESRFDRFLTTDGEKPWRDRDAELEDRVATRAEILHRWESGWTKLFHALEELSDADLSRRVRIRAQPMSVVEALHKALGHISYHVGQMVYAGKLIRGRAWEPLSVPMGQTAEYNRRLMGEASGEDPGEG